MRTCFLLLVATSLAAQAPASVTAPQTPEILIRQRKLVEARAILQADLAKNKNDHAAMYWMGRAAYAEEKTDDALDWFEKAAKLDDKNAVYHLWIGNAVGDKAQNANKLKQPFLAKRVKNEFERAVALDPKLIDAREGLVGFYSQAPGFMGGGMDKAKEQAAEISKLNPYRGQMNLSRIAREEKDTVAEMKAYEGAIAVAPDSVGGYYSLAGMYRRQQRWDDAFAIYEKLMKLGPNEAVPHLGWGAVSSQSGKSMDRGERELKHFLSVATLEKDGNANVAGGHFRLGQLYEKTSRKDLAKAEYQETLKINPQHADAKKSLAALK